jgi:hypothetical protein
MDTYRKIATIEAYHYPFADDVPQDFKDAVKVNGNGEYYVKTMEGDTYPVTDTWIARGIHGEFWPIDNKVFADSYEKIEDAGNGN